MNCSSSGSCVARLVRVSRTCVSNYIKATCQRGSGCDDRRRCGENYELTALLRGGMVDSVCSVEKAAMDGGAGRSGVARAVLSGLTGIK